MIGILAPYGRGEATCAAIRLANLVTRLGEDVRLIAVGRVEPGVHNYWDHRVCSSRGDGLYVAARGCDVLVHFQPDKELRRKTDLVAPGAKQVLVPQWHRLRREDDAQVANHHAIVCSSEEMRRHVRDTVFAGVEPTQVFLSWALWDAGIPAVCRDGPVATRRVGALVVVNNGVADVDRRVLLSTLDAALGANAKLAVTLASNKSWRRRDRLAVAAMAGGYGARVASLAYRSQDDLSKLLHANDWCVLPCTRADFSGTAMLALACGTPVIAYDVPPLSEVVADGRNGYLVPCECVCGPLGARTAVADTAAAGRELLDVFGRAFTGNANLARMQATDWGVEEHAKSFNKFWAVLLGLAEAE